MYYSHSRIHLHKLVVGYIYIKKIQNKIWDFYKYKKLLNLSGYFNSYDILVANSVLKTMYTNSCYYKHC
jgi:hypothetical protein